MKRAVTVAVVLIFLSTFMVAAQTKTGSERTVEESYLQQSMEIMIIKQQAYSESKDMKLSALNYIKKAVSDGRKNEEMSKVLSYLATEASSVVVKSGGVGRTLNNFPDIRWEACRLLGEFGNVDAKDTLVTVIKNDTEPTVLANAIRSLGKIGMNDNDEVTQLIYDTIFRFHYLNYDDSLAFEAIYAIENLAKANGGLRDPAAIATLMLLAEGPYDPPVKNEAKKLFARLMNMTPAKSSSTGK